MDKFNKKNRKVKKIIKKDLKSHILTTKQQEIANKVVRWYYVNSYQKNHFSIGGVAGS